MAAPVRTGTASNVNGSAASGSTSVTVPADAEAVVAFSTHFQSNNNSTLSTLTLNGVAFTVDSQVAEGAVSNRPGVYVGHLLAPATGSQTLAWAWSNAAARNNGGKLILVYVKGINSGDFKRDSGVGTSGGNSSVTLATETTDLLLACASNYSAALNLDGTEFIDDSTLLTFVYDASEVTPSATSTTVNMTGGATATGMGAISLKEPTAGSNSDGNASFTLGAITFAATAEHPYYADADFTLGAVTFAATAEHPYQASASFGLGAISFSATAGQNIPDQDADASFTLGAITFAATAINIQIDADADFTLDGFNFSSSAINTQIDADAAFTLGAITFLASAEFEIQPATYTEREIHEALCEWLTAQTGLVVIRDHQSGVRPPLVYLMAELVMVRATHEHPINFKWYDLATLNLAGKQDKFGVPVIEREWDFMVSAYGEPGSTHLRELNARVQFSQLNEQITETAMVHSMTDVSMISEEVEHGWERRAYCNLRIRAFEPDGAIVDVIEEASADYQRI